MPSPFAVAGGLKDALEAYQFFDELLAYSTVGSVQKTLMIPSIAAALALRIGVINDIEGEYTS